MQSRERWMEERESIFGVVQPPRAQYGGNCERNFKRGCEVSGCDRICFGKEPAARAVFSS